MLKQEGNLFINDDNVLYRKSKEQHQIILPHAFKEDVCRGLHINILVQTELYKSSGKDFAGQK